MSDTSTSALFASPIWRWCLLTVVFAVVLGVLAFQWGRRTTGYLGSTKFAIVDLADIVSKHQQRSIAALADTSVDDNSRTRALAQAKAFGRQLDDAVSQLSSECDCVLLVREAVVAGQLDDLTPALRTRLAQK